MVKERQNVPLLRFPEFSGAWVEKRLKEIGSVVTGTTPSTFVDKYYDGDYMFVSPYDISNSRYVIATKTTITELGMTKCRIIPKGSVMFVCIGSTIGKIAQATLKCATNQQINTIVPFREINAGFLYSLLETNASIIKLLAGEQAVPMLNKSDFSNIKLKFTSIFEQTKIAEFLSVIDDRIDLLTQKKKMLETYKKGVMQKLFSQELRFKDENGNDYPDWQRRQAKELFVSVTNKKHTGNLPILAITQEGGAVVRDSINYKVQVSEASIASYKVIDKGDFIISLRSFQGGIEYSNINGICSPAYTILKPRINIINQYFRYYFKRDYFIQELSNTVEGIRDGKNISYSNFGALYLVYPNLAEQQKIANFLSAIDDKIAALNDKINNSQQYKKGLLQQMFV